MKRRTLIRAPVLMAAAPLANMHGKGHASGDGAASG